MKPKTIISGVLIAFVVLSVAQLVRKEGGTVEPVVDECITSEEVGSGGVESNAAGIENAVLAYYFYGNVRCQTCRKIEAYTAGTISNAFKNELSGGQLLWKTVNVDEKENEHFVKDYELTSRSVVLVEIVDGKQLRWKNLAQIWDLVGDEVTFRKYITDETTGFLAGGKM